ncbi:Glycoside hydrolase-type carbohydrate-binding, subgroup [Cordyceps fumosorosea ARSEF 2679]|uniref:Glucose-6-phosphate 1-epimerase n=1 Tax=Cordyceps fumosorosea (strain ARSEF 2679) TaxID=1081104 RepID=A0A167NYF1_CORFA|nr:Glycoside hydrolase-type carbohydrate-binding, subgroup [Cordyceps fumosorosea ARSEF 2679]OAA56084.1 Glycoside hydrolase-type carbohydrate-binding, subgroup [Cordyceps fumosorosea ARSEF 2679]
MVDRPNKPSALATTPGLPPQAQVTISHGNARVTAALPTGESVVVLLHGATVISWKDASGDEKLWLSEAAHLDGSKAVRGGIPLVFPVFGAGSNGEKTKDLPQHGFARNARWEFLGKSTSEGDSANVVKLDFGLSSESLADEYQKAWPYRFGLLYSVTLTRESLTTTIVITNDGDEPFEFQTLLHTYFRVKDISQVSIDGFDGAPYIDQLANRAAKTHAGAITFDGELDSIYTPAGGPKQEVTLSEGGRRRVRLVRDNLEDVVVWNPHVAKAAGMADFAPKDGWRNMVCIEAGSVRGWQRLDKGDAFEGAQTIHL